MCEKLGMRREGDTVQYVILKKSGIKNGLVRCGIEGSAPNERYRGKRLLRCVLRNLPGVFENLQGLQARVSGRLPGFELAKVQEEMLPDQRLHYLQGLRGV